MLPNSSLRSVFISYISSSLLAEDLFGNIPSNPTISMQPRNSPGTDVYNQKEATNLTRNASFLKGDTNLTKEGSFSFSTFGALQCN